MALESFDFENKLFAPTRALIEAISTQIQSDLVNYYLYVRQALINLHSIVASEGKRWYENPIDVSQQWFEQLVNFGTSLYTQFNQEWKPQIQSNFDLLSEKTATWLSQIQNTLEYIVENPEQVSTETIETLTETVSELGSASSELVEELQIKSQELIEQLANISLQTLEDGSIELINSLLNSYVSLINEIVTSIPLS